MAVVIRELLARDRYALAALMRDVAGKHVDDRNPHVASFLTDSSTFAFGAYLDERPVGWVWGHAQRFPDGRVASYVHEIDVLSDVRRRGVGSMLMRAVLARAKRAGHHHVWLTTEAANDAANGLYRSIGGQRPEADGDAVWVWRIAGP